MKNMLRGGRKDLIGFGKVCANLCAAGGCLHLEVNKRHFGFLTLHLRGMQAEGSHFFLHVFSADGLKVVRIVREIECQNQTGREGF